jgi:S1-C subfamily serine protease
MPDKADVPRYLQEISYTIEVDGDDKGSGVVFTRDGRSFIWTAAHVVKGLRKQEEVIAADGTKRQRVTFRDAAIVQEQQQDGRRVGETTYDVRLVKYDAEEDLALCEVRKRGFTEKTAVFYLDKTIPAVGTRLFHCGSPGGQQLGANSVTPGIVAQTGRVLNEHEFDQVTCPSLGGSSGGGVYREDGQYTGMLVLGIRDTDSFGYVIPVRRIKRWATRCNVLWAVDPSIPLPDEEALKRLPVEDSGFEERTPTLAPKDAGRLELVPVTGAAVLERRSVYQ